MIKPGQIPSCACGELGSLTTRVKPKAQKSADLIQVTCPRCGQVYRTNREPGLCFNCRNKAST